MPVLMVKKAIVAGIFAHEPAFLEKMPGWGEDVPLCIDSRSVPEQSIFFAIKGEVHDGHDFIEEARAQGASLVVAEKYVESKIPLILVNDPLKTFSRIAHRHLLSMPALRIALTGSNGKTTVKEMIKAGLSAVLGSQAVYANPGTLNNHFGVPLSALEVNPRHQVAIFELGMNHQGEIADLCEIVEPQIGLVTNIGVAHQGNFTDGILGVQKAKGELFLALAQGHAVINMEDERVLAEANSQSFAHKTTFGSVGKSDIWLEERKNFCVNSGLQPISIEQKDGSRVDFNIPLPGIHHAKNAVAALAVIKALGYPVEIAAQGLVNMTTTGGRMSLSVVDRCLLINDGYNANPLSMEAGILACLEFEAPRRLAVIGAMGELGPLSDRYHFELGQLLAKHFQKIFVCGELAVAVIKGAESQGLKAPDVVYKNTSEELIEPVRRVMGQQDLIFIKGSKFTKMQVLARALAEKI